MATALVDSDAPVWGFGGWGVHRVGNLTVVDGAAIVVKPVGRPKYVPVCSATQRRRRRWGFSVTTEATFPTVHASGLPYGQLAANNCREQLSIAYAHAVTTAARCTLEDIKVDYQTVDAVIRQTADHAVYDVAAIDVQLKATSQDILKEGHLAYSLETKYYDALRSPRRMNPVILVVMLLPAGLDQWIVQDEDHLRLHRSAYWISLRDMPPVQTESTTIHIPRSQKFDVEQLLGILSRVGDGGYP